MPEVDGQAFSDTCLEVAGASLAFNSASLAQIIDIFVVPI